MTAANELLQGVDLKGDQASHGVRVGWCPVWKTGLFLFVFQQVLAAVPSFRPVRLNEQEILLHACAQLSFT